MVGSVAGEEGLRRLVNYQGSVNIKNDVLLDSLNKLNEITDVVDSGDLQQVREGLGKVFKQLQAGEGNTAFFKSHGAANEVYELAYRLQNGAKLKGVQVSEKISAAVRDLGGRVYDYQLEIGGRIISYDKKAWTPADIEDRLRKSLKSTAASTEDVTSQVGQLYKDIVQSYRGDGFGSIRWVFDQRMLDAYGGDVGKMSNALGDQVADMIENNKELKQQLMRDLGLRFGDDSDERIFTRNLISRLPEMFEATPDVVIGN